MTCKDCLHYGAHKHFFKSDDYGKDFDDYFKDKNVECKCPEFTNRFEWLHIHGVSKITRRKKNK